MSTEETLTKQLVQKGLNKKRFHKDSQFESAEKQKLALYIRENSQAHSISEICRLMRLAIGKTQSAWAKQLGTNVVTVRNIESGKGNPTIKTLTKMGKLFGLQVSFTKRPS